MAGILIHLSFATYYLSDMRTRHMGKLENLRITTNNDNDNDDDGLALVSAMMMMMMMMMVRE
jgi:hypothetical protein